MKRIKKEIEYEDAPCGYVTFYNYKEPLMPFKEGFGFIGALVFDGKTGKAQCHFCGEWVKSLPLHIRYIHKMKAREYKFKVGLLQTTVLISEETREKMLMSASLPQALKNIKPGTYKRTKKQNNKIRKTMLANRMNAEYRNIRGTCPMQIIDRMQKIAKEKGDKLRMTDFKSFEESIQRTYGSIKEACSVAGINYRRPGETFKRKLLTPEQTRETLIEDLRRFERINGRRPALSDSRRGLLSRPQTFLKYFGHWSVAYDLAFNNK